jgi:hypothetical protein
LTRFLGIPGEGRPRISSAGKLRKTLRKTHLIKGAIPADIMAFAIVGPEAAAGCGRQLGPIHPVFRENTRCLLDISA